MDNLEKQLRDMGFTEDEIQYYRKLTAAGECSTPQRLRMLMDKRKEALAEIHKLEENITDMDRLRQKIRKKS